VPAKQLFLTSYLDIRMWGEKVEVKKSEALFFSHLL
jgi:hypothetical protein